MDTRSAHDQPRPPGDDQWSPLQQAVHTMRTHLTVMIGHAQLVQRRVIRRDDISEYDRHHISRSTQTIDSSGRALAKIIRELDPDLHQPPSTP